MQWQKTLLSVPFSDQNRREQKGHLDSGSDAEISAEAPPDCTYRRCQWPVLTAVLLRCFGVSPTQRILYSHTHPTDKGPELVLHSAAQYQGYI